MESVLESIKEPLNIAADDTSFDSVIIRHINSVLNKLTRLGVGPSKPASISSASDTWTGTLGDVENMASIKDYVYLKVRLVFDPPTSSFVLNSIKEEIKELEWELNAHEDI